MLKELLDFIIYLINENKKIFIPIVVALISALITIHYKETRIKRQRFEKEYAAFRNIIFPVIGMLEQGSHLNTILLSEFPVHEEAKRNFINNLRGIRRKRFKKKWDAYENKYYEIKNLGLSGAFAAIAPNTEALNSNPPHSVVQGWEDARKEQLIKIICSILEISKRNWWL